MKIQEVNKRFPDGIPLLDPVEDMNIKDERMKSIVRKIEAFEKRMYKHSLHKRDDMSDVYKLIGSKKVHKNSFLFQSCRRPM